MMIAYRKVVSDFWVLNSQARFCMSGPPDGPNRDTRLAIKFTRKHNASPLPADGRTFLILDTESDQLFDVGEIIAVTTLQIPHAASTLTKIFGDDLSLCAFDFWAGTGPTAIVAGDGVTIEADEPLEFEKFKLLTLQKLGANSYRFSREKLEG